MQLVGDSMSSPLRQLEASVRQVGGKYQLKVVIPHNEKNSGSAKLISEAVHDLWKPNPAVADKVEGRAVSYPDRLELTVETGNRVQMQTLLNSFLAEERKSRVQIPELATAQRLGA